MESEKIEIIDFSGERFNNFRMPCWIIIVFITALAIFNIYLMITTPESPLATLLSIGLILIFVLYYYYVATRSPGKLRKVSISYEEIEVTLPHKPQFLIQWSEFEKIEVKLKKLRLKPFNVYYFHFFNHTTEKKFTLTLNDFHKSKIIEILKLLRERAFILKKEFVAIKETQVSGIHFIEDFEIN
ncbi:MAG: hypothetical protein KGD58_03295 [Candidatus Lokiarchaeota archaeon]|nr:hypothetical protein [Candidatus Lokiarchaeota archaeon]